MDQQEGVAYMVMGEGGEMTPVTQQPTQVVAIDNGDGTQQYAIPVIDPETGQETYMIIDPETAQNITNGTATVTTDGQQLMVVDNEANVAEVVGDQGQGQAVVVDTAQDQGNVMVMLPNGEQGIVVSGAELGEGVLAADGKQYVMASAQEAATVVSAGTGNGIVTSIQSKPKLSESSSMIKIVGIQDKKPSPGITLSRPLQTRTSYTNYQPSDATDKSRAPRKQSLGKVQNSNVVPLGLTGDLFKDTALVEAKVAQICAEVNMTEKEKERLRLNLMTKGLSSGTGLGRGRRVMQPNRSPLTKITKQVNKTIKCDMCKKEFPANVDESILINHVKTVHMNKKEEVHVCRKCDRRMPTATALKYHTCSQERFQCPDCNKLFMQRSTLVEHQAVAHRPKQPTPPPQPSVTEAKEEVECKEEDSKTVIAPVETPKKDDVVKKLADDWEEEDGKMEVPDIDDTKKTGDDVKQEDADEDQIVADVDDILKDTDTIMSDVDTMLSTKKKPAVTEKKEVKEVSSRLVDEEEVIQSLVDKKKKSSQCEECYECFEDPEKLAWHALNDH